MTVMFWWILTMGDYRFSWHDLQTSRLSCMMRLLIIVSCHLLLVCQIE